MVVFPQLQPCFEADNFSQFHHTSSDVGHHWNYATFFQQIACKMIWRSMTNQMCVELHGYSLKFTLLVANSKCGLHIVLSYTSLTG